MKNEEILQHHGIKGMRWGVRRSKEALSKAGGAVKDKAKTTSESVKSTAKDVKKKTANAYNKYNTRLKEEAASKRRERDWANELDKVGGMSTKELQNKGNRVRLENEMKALTKRSGDAKKSGYKEVSNDSKDYRNRAKLSDKELQAKVERLRAKDMLRREISSATKAHRDKSKEFIESMGKGIDEYQPYVTLGKQIIDFKYGKY